MKNINKFLMILIFVFSSVSCVSAFAVRDSESDKLSIRDGLSLSSKSDSQDQTGGSVFAETDLTGQIAESDNSRREGYLRIDSIQPLGDTSEESSSFFSGLSGLQFSYASQNGDNPSGSFNLSLGEYPIFSYSLQKTNPYFISSSLLGEKTYMIYSEDQFEEKLVDAIYRFAAKSGTDTNLPDINEAYEIIQAFRDGRIQLKPSQTESIQTFSFDREIDTSAFETFMMNLMMRFTEAEPTNRDGYYYTDLTLQSRAFEWPDETALPEFPKQAAAVSITFTQKDILDLLEVLPHFFADNSELAAAINQYIQTVLAQTNPEIAQLKDVDFITEILNGLEDSVSIYMKDFSLSFKMDMDEYGAPVLFTVDLINNKNGEQNESIICFHMINDDKQTILEISADFVQGGQTFPILRGLGVMNAGEDGTNNISINFRGAAQENTAFEYYQKTENKGKDGYAHSSNSDIHFDWNGERGALLISNTKTPNEFQGNDSFTQVSYTHVSQGTPIFTASLSGESKTTEPLPGLTASDAAAVSQMSEADYDSLVTGFFMQLMMLSMAFG